MQRKRPRALPGRLLLAIMGHLKNSIVNKVCTCTYFISRMMYWSDWSSSNAQNGKIETAWMNGDQRKVFVDTELQWPNGLTIDYFNRKLYWCDSYLNKIERISLSGIDREVSSNNAFVCGYSILSTLKPSFSDFDGTRFRIGKILDSANFTDLFRN